MSNRKKMTFGGNVIIKYNDNEVIYSYFGSILSYNKYHRLNGVSYRAWGYKEHSLYDNWVKININRLVI